METISAVQSVEIAQLSRDLLSQVLSVNGTYLAVSVSIILGSGILLSVLMYFFNFKPMKEGLDKQTENIENIKKETELKVQDLKNSQSEVSSSLQDLKDENKIVLENLRSVSAEEVESIKKLFQEQQVEFDERIRSETESMIHEVESKIALIEKAALEKIIKLEDKNQTLDLKTTWDMHYTWENQGVYVNVLSSIVSTLQKVIEYSVSGRPYEGWIKLCLDKLPVTIDKVMTSDPKVFASLPDTLNQLESCLSLITLYPVERAEIIIKIQNLRKVLM